MLFKRLILFIAALGTVTTLHAQPTPSYYQSQDTGVYQNQMMDIAGWCDNQLTALRIARNDAIFASNNGDFSSAKRILQNGLSNASRNTFGENGPLTQMLIHRGSVFSRELDTYLTQIGDFNKDKEIVTFLEAQFDLIEDVSINIDVPYYTPGNCGYCQANFRNFDNELVMVAQKQLDIVINKFVIAQHKRNGVKVYPFGGAEFVLKLFEMATYFAKSDLNRSMYRGYYSCRIQTLQMIHGRLLAFNNSGRGNNAQAQKMMLSEAFFTSRDVADSLTALTSCSKY